MLHAKANKIFIFHNPFDKTPLLHSEAIIHDGNVRRNQPQHITVTISILTAHITTRFLSLKDSVLCGNGVVRAVGVERPGGVGRTACQ